MEKLLNYLLKNQDKLLIFGVSLFFLLLTLPSLISDKHFLYNLEPYPDGLFYSLSARNLVEQGRLELQMNGVESYISQPPLYSLVLTTGYLLWNNPASFYVINTILLLFTLLIITKIIITKTKNNFIKIIATFLLLSHGYLLWTVSLPMTENLVLLLFSAGLYFVTKQTFTKKDLVFTAGLSILLVLTRISIIPTALTFSGIGLYKIWGEFDVKNKKISIIIGLVSLVIVNILYYLILQKTIIDQAIYFFKETFYSDTQNGFYSIKYIGQNSISYLNRLFGKPSNYLWITHPLTSLWFVISIISNYIFNKNISKNVIPLIIIFLSLFSLLLTFYIADSRYIVYIIPLFIVLFVETAPKKISIKQRFFYLTLLVLHVSTQLPIFKQIISENILHRSQAWQYEAIKNISEFAKDHQNAKLITALPPYLVTAYSTQNIQLLPLSTDQEFLKPGQKLWGSDVEYDNLPKYFEKQLEDEEVIYITNSYITHQQTVTQDYEVLQNMFTFSLVRDGCFNACNIYQIKLKQ